MPARRLTLLFLCATLIAALTGCYSVNSPFPRTGEGNNPGVNFALPGDDVRVTVKPGQLESYARVYAVVYEDSTELLPHSSDKALTPLEIHDLTPYQLEWGWREIAARHGKTFVAHDFKDRAWFEADDDFDPTGFSEIEADNIIQIRSALARNNARFSKAEGAVKADVDGDGQEDTLSFLCVEAADEGVLTINGSEYPIELPRMDGAMYLTDIDEDDGAMEIAMPYTIPGGTRYTALFGLDTDGLYSIGSVPGDLTTIRFFGGGELDGDAPGGILTRWFYRQPYKLSEGKLYKTAVSVRPIMIKTALKRDLTLKAAMTGDARDQTVTFAAGAAVLLLAADADDNVAVMDVQSRVSGYMHISDFDAIDEAGERQSEVFTTLVRIDGE